MASSPKIPSVCRIDNHAKNLRFPGMPENSFTFFSVFLLSFDDIKSKTLSVSRIVDNAQNYGSRVRAKIRSHVFHFHDLLDVLIICLKITFSGQAQQLIHSLFSFHGVLDGIKSENIK